jgi:SAM-dependent methyltransferase
MTLERESLGKKTAAQALWDLIGIPFRLLLFDQAWLPRFGWTTLEEERLRAVLPHIRGRLLDIGAGPNTLVNSYGNGEGVDVHPWGGGVRVVEDTSKLDYPDDSFDTVTFVACLNHIPYREAALREAARVLRPEGRLILTMIDPVLGGIGHALWWYSEDKKRGGMKEGERGGLWPREILRLCSDAGFTMMRHERFVCGMNHLFVFRLLDPGRE